MKLNPECVRSLMLAIESNLVMGPDLNTPYAGFEMVTKWEGLQGNHSPEEVAYTTQKLDEAGLINVSIYYPDGSFDAIYSSLTYEGHQFLENIRSPEAWRKTTDILGKVGNFALSSIKAVSEGVATVIINEYLNPRG